MLKVGFLPFEFVELCCVFTRSSLGIVLLDSPLKLKYADPRQAEREASHEAFGTTFSFLMFGFLATFLNSYNGLRL